MLENEKQLSVLQLFLKTSSKISVVFSRNILLQQRRPNCGCFIVFGLTDGKWGVFYFVEVRRMFFFSAYNSLQLNYIAFGSRVHARSIDSFLNSIYIQIPLRDLNACVQQDSAID